VRVCVCACVRVRVCVCDDISGGVSHSGYVVVLSTIGVAGVRCSD